MNFAIIYPRDIDALRIEKKAIIIDIRSRKAYGEAHWEGAINYPEGEVTDYSKVLSKRRLIIIYCQHGGSSMQLARNLGRNSYQTGTVVGGFEAMKKYKENQEKALKK